MADTQSSDASGQFKLPYDTWTYLQQRAQEDDPQDPNVENFIGEGVAFGIQVLHLMRNNRACGYPTRLYARPPGESELYYEEIEAWLRAEMIPSNETDEILSMNITLDAAAAEELVLLARDFETQPTHIVSWSLGIYDMMLDMRREGYDLYVNDGAEGDDYREITLVKGNVDE